MRRANVMCTYQHYYQEVCDVVGVRGNIALCSHHHPTCQHSLRHPRRHANTVHHAGASSRGGHDFVRHHRRGRADRAQANRPPHQHCPLPGAAQDRPGRWPALQPAAAGVDATALRPAALHRRLRGEQPPQSIVVGREVILLKFYLNLQNI